MLIDHRAEALRLLADSDTVLRPHDDGPCEADRLIAAAQVHATLATIPAALPGVDPEQYTAAVAELGALRKVVAHFIADHRGDNRYADGAALLHTMLVDQAGLTLGGELDKLLDADTESNRRLALVAELAAAANASASGAAEEYRTLGEIVRTHPAAAEMTPKQVDELMRDVYSAVGDL